MTEETTTDKGTPGVLTALRISAGVTALAALMQAVLGIGILTGATSWFPTHATSGIITMVLAVVTAVCAVLWQRRSGNTGMMMHAITVGVLGIAQFGLGEAGIRLVHTIVGVVFLVAAVALVTLSMRPGGAGRRGLGKA